MFFTEKRYRSIDKGSINSNTTNFISPDLFNIRVRVLKSQIRNSVEGHYSAVTVDPPTYFYLNFCTKRDTKLVNSTQESIVVVLETLPADSLHGLPDQSSALFTRPFRIARKLALTCLNTQTTLHYRHQKWITVLIITILFEINACNNKLSNNNRREGRITSRLVG